MFVEVTISVDDHISITSVHSYFMFDNICQFSFVRTLFEICVLQQMWKTEQLLTKKSYTVSLEFGCIVLQNIQDVVSMGSYYPGIWEKSWMLREIHYLVLFFILYDFG